MEERGKKESWKSDERGEEGGEEMEMDHGEKVQRKKQNLIKGREKKIGEAREGRLLCLLHNRLLIKLPLFAAPLRLHY